ncbi:Toxin A [uncultured Dorea sp.]|uniref:hypothetical protein n=1 Tax=Dorea formicigenerans TaxID=39486 RepID=UPI0008224FB5|nr:hypothetical protein [uncultured Dorea sp.]SCH25914.1 Toxin A [uncultured Dorea sp.]
MKLREKYLADSDGAIIVKSSAWYYANNQKWYYFDRNGNPLSYKIEKIGGKEYYFNYQGEMQTGVFEAEYYDENDNWVNKKMYADVSGAIVTSAGWKLVGGTWYYVKEDGTGASNEIVEINGKRYSFDWDGKMQTGLIWQYEESGNGYYIYADASGAIASQPQWGLVDGNWYYTQADETIITDEFKEINGVFYKFDTDGVMIKGIFYDNEDKYFAQSSGAIVRNGWARDGVDWYYAGKDGKLLTSQWVGDFYFDEDGIMAVGVVETEDGAYVFDDNGRKVAEIGTTAGWQLADGTWYYYDAPGKQHNGWLNSKYYIDNGKMKTEDIVPAMGDTSREAYVGADGIIVQNGWVYERYGESWFYSENGMLVEDGWKTINGKKYYFSSIYMNRLSFREIDGKLYEFDGSGACRGEIAKKNSWYQSPDGSWYWFNED